MKEFRRAGVSALRAPVSAALAVGCTFIAVLWSVLVLDGHLHHAVRDAAVQQAELVAALAVEANLPPGDGTAQGLPPLARTAIATEAARLRAQGRLAALALRAGDGQLLYADDPNGALVEDSHRRSAAGAAVRVDELEPQDGEPLIMVTLPLDSAAAGGQVLLDVLLPQGPADRMVRSSMRMLYLLGGTIQILVIVLVVTGRRRLRAREREARSDALTGLGNRRHLLEAYDSAVAGRRRLLRHAVVLLDLDGFKAVNDTLGHETGDALLRNVAQVLREDLGRGNTVVRLGGDEFAVLLEDLPSVDAAHRRARELRAVLVRSAFNLDGVRLAVQASVGVAVYPDHGQSCGELLDQADTAMYAAKRAQTGVELYRRAADGADVNRLGMLAELSRGLIAGELRLDYQPKMNLADGVVTGAEALVRWDHPTRGLLRPEQFLPLIECTGLMHEVTDWALGEALRQAAQWAARDLAIPVAVNLSRSSLVATLPARILKLLSDHTVAAALLEIHVPDDAVAAARGGTANVLRQIRALGARISLTDFAGGATSLAQLSSGDVHSIMISPALTGTDGSRMLGAVVELGHRLGLRVLADRVDDEAARDAARRLGCDEIQGTLLTPPLAPEEFDRWLSGYRNGDAPAATPAVPPTVPAPRTCSRRALQE